VLAAVAVGRDDVLRAAEVVRDRVHHTPTFTASSLGPGVALKAELFQRTGSFKVRGVLTKLASLSMEEKERGVIGISAGNHAQALAWGAREAGVDALVVMWRGASEAKIAATRGYGSEVDLEASGPTEAFDRLAQLLDETGRTLVHPFDDPLVIAGQGTVGLELLEDAGHVETVLVAAGGGGLVSGVAAAVAGRSRVVAVEPELSTAVHEGLAAGRSMPVRPSSIADGLSAPFAGENALA
jgi:threonine dehydratase